MKEFGHVREDPLRIVYAEIPQQDNTFDCGVYMLKFMENWNNQPLEGYTSVFMKDARREYAINWITHPLNEHREELFRGVGVQQNYFRSFSPWRQMMAMSCWVNSMQQKTPHKAITKHEETQLKGALSILRLSECKAVDGHGEIVR
ncbi:Ulp1 peptidase [Bertholletia excelsa]